MKITQNEKAFAAFFLGEGMIRISREFRKAGNYKSVNYGKDKKVFYRHIAKITLRQDDEAILDWVQKNIGGHVFRRGVRDKVWNKQKGTFTWSRPTTIWQAEDLDTCEKIARLLIKCPIPGKKKEEAKIFLKYILLKRKNRILGKPYKKEVLVKFEEYHQKMKNLKKYKGS